MLIVGTGAIRFFSRQYESARQRSINQLLDSSRGNEADGRLDQALIDLDTAIEMARKAGPAEAARINDRGKNSARPGSPRGPAGHRRPAPIRPLDFPAR